MHPAQSGPSSRSGPSSFSRTARNLFACLLAFVLWPAAAQSQVAGWGHDGLQLFRVHIDSLGSPTFTPLGPLDGVDPIAPGPAGQLYAVEDALEPRLLEVDLDTGVTTVIGPVFPAPMPDQHADLTLDDDGTLWYVHSESLYVLDPTTGAATLVAPVHDLVRLSHFAGVLYGLLLAGDQTVQIAEIGTDGTSSPLATLAEYGVDFPYSTSAVSFDFDGAGGAWIHALQLNIVGDPPAPRAQFFYYPDPFSGQPGQLVHTGNQRLLDFAVDRLPVGSVADVPALSPLGGLVLALALGFAGWRRRRHDRRQH